MPKEIRSRRVPHGALLTTLLLFLVPFAPTGSSAAPSIGRLSPATPVRTWTGGPFSGPLGLPGASNPFPILCVINCERRSLTIDFPASTWTRPRDGVTIAIRHANSHDALNLFVFGPDGRRIGASDGLDSDAQAVFIPHPRNGRYTVAVTATELESSGVTYEGRAWLRRDPCTQGNCKLLPKLMPKPPFDFHITGLPIAPSTFAGMPLPIPPGPATNRSCWLDEMLAQGANRCLRFSNQIDNVGGGSLILRFQLLQPLRDPGVDLRHEYLTGCAMQQVIEFDNGTTITRPAGSCVFHIPHGHFHYENMATFALHKVNGDGSTGALLRESDKQGFCLVDGRAHAFGSDSFEARRHWFPNCNLPSAVDGYTWVRMGISAGWGDVYTWDVPAQYIEISGVPNGVYDVISIVNPGAEILEAEGHFGGSARTRICLTVSGVRELAPDARSCR